jgi:hypothetical protein
MGVFVIEVCQMLLGDLCSDAGLRIMSRNPN